MYAAGLEYIQLCLHAENVHCDDQLCTYINLLGDSIEICNNEVDDDGDGLVDLI